MADDPVLLDFDGALARVTLNRPHAANAINLALAGSMLDAMTACEHHRGLRAVLVRGAGKLFCGGGDVRALAEADDLAVLLRELTAVWHAALTRLVGLDVPVVMAVQGAAAGAGLGLLGAADIVLASERARFRYAYADVGLGPDGGTSYFLTRMVGPRRATELALTGRVLSAAEAQEWGLVTTVVPAGDPDLAAADDLAARLAAGPTVAFGAAKRLLREGQQRSLVSHLEVESRTIAETGAGRDAVTGVRGYLQGIEPDFTGG